MRIVVVCYSSILLVFSSTLLTSSSSCRAETAATPPLRMKSTTTAPSTATTTTTATTATTTPVGGSQNNQQLPVVVYYSPLALERALYIRGILTQRLSYVGSGRRLQDFTHWVQQNGGEAQVWSMHGRSGGQHGGSGSGSAGKAGNQESDDSSGSEDEPSSSSSSSKRRRLFGSANSNRRNEDDPFPTDRMNLDIVATSLEAPPSQFPNNHPQQYLLDDDDAGNPSVVTLLLRAIRLSMHFSPVLTTSALALVSPTFRRNVWYRWLASCIGSAGAAWIKWGQWSSTRSDMFPEALCDELARLHNDAPRHAFEISQLAVESSLGLCPGTLWQVFDQFDTMPLASGSIAQVHKAILDGTTLVAVKIRHSLVAQLMACDFRLMHGVAQLLETCLPQWTRWLHLSASVNQFSHTMAQQGDLHVEAHHLEVLNYNFRHWKSTVRFPKPFYASSSVIIETFEPGRIVTDLLDTYDAWATLLNLENNANAKQEQEASSAATASSTALVTQQQSQSQSQSQSLISGNELIPMDICKFLVVTGINIYLKMLLVDNLMHADLHPGE
jgi:ABC1 atypical kinase-like domain